MILLVSEHASYWTSTSFAVSGIVFAFATAFQIIFFLTNIRKLGRLKTLFPPQADAYSVGIGSGGVMELRVDNPQSRSFVSSLIEELNLYVERNHGTTDFAIIQNKTDRRVGALQSDATARVAFPTYIGLMGTFVGVFIGLVFFLFGLKPGTGITDDTVGDLINGVLVSMSTSFVGLFLTTITHWRAAEALRVLAERKNVFYEFVQNELMPTLGVSMVAALSKLHDTINSFTPAFNSVIDRFQATFDTCTASFGKAFEANVKCVAGAVEAMGANMDRINQNIELQKRLLDSLGSSKVLKSLEAFVKASERFSMITALLNQVEALIANLHDSTASLLNAQSNYSDSLALPKAVAEQLNNILDRFVRFETSINALGERLSDDQLLGNAMLATVNKQLDNLEAKRVQIESYVDISSEELAGIFRLHDAAIKKISTSFNDRLAQQADEFVTILNSVTSGLRAARTELIELFNQKFDVAEIRHEFSQLELLPDIKEGMVRTKDEASRAKNEAARAKEEATFAKDEASRAKDEATLARNEASQAKDEAARAGGVAYQIGEEINRNSSDTAARTNAQQQQLHDMLSHLESIETQIKSILTDKERWYDKWFRHK